MSKAYTTENAEVCANCEHSVRIEGSEACLCSKNGLVKDVATCRKYRLDLLKIEPLPIRKKNI